MEKANVTPSMIEDRVRIAVLAALDKKALDLDVLAGNLDRMAAYAALHGLVLRPHVKTHKAPRIAAEQLGSGNAWLQIKELNKDVLRNGEGVLPNMRLRLPARSVSSAAD